MSNKNHWLLPYAVAVLLVGAAFVVRYALSSLIGGQLPTWITFYPAVMLVALLGGLGPGLLATATAALAAYYFLLLPEGFVFKGLVNTFSETVFSCMGVLISVIVGRYRLTRDRLEDLVAIGAADLSRTNKQLTQEIDGRERAEERSMNLASFPQLNPNPVIEVDSSGKVTFFNASALKTLESLGLDEGEIDALLPPDLHSTIGNWDKRSEKTLQREIIVKDRVFDQTVQLVPQFGVVRLYAADITDRKKDQWERETMVNFLRLVNESRDTRELVREATTFFHELSGFEAVGIRLREGCDYPYFETRGFSAEFVLAENRLCACDKDGQPILDSAGSPALDCMCGNVICRRFDISKPFFTKRGNFFSNSTTRLLATSTEKDRKARTRNRCNGEGYESVALIGLRLGDERLGLLQLNDRRKNRFTPESLALWERLADYLAVALAKFRTDEKIIKLNKDLIAKNEELEFTNKELESFIYSVSHDLRGPLRAISGFGDLMKKNVADKLDEHGKQYLSRIQRGTEKMSRLIDDLLSLSRISRQGIQRKSVDLSGLASSILSALREANPGRSVEADIKEGLTVFADPGLIEIVLSNLLDNAWKFTAKTEHACIEFGTLAQNSKIIYYVRDNGAGFNQQYAGKMFLPFHRLHSESAFEGTGIGLAIVDRIITRHGGKIWAEGAEGKGAAIYFTLT